MWALCALPLLALLAGCEEGGPENNLNNHLPEASARPWHLFMPRPSEDDLKSDPSTSRAPSDFQSAYGRDDEPDDDNHPNPVTAARPVVNAPGAPGQLMYPGLLAPGPMLAYPKTMGVAATFPASPVLPPPHQHGWPMMPLYGPMHPPMFAAAPHVPLHYDSGSDPSLASTSPAQGQQVIGLATQERVYAAEDNETMHNVTPETFHTPEGPPRYAGVGPASEDSAGLPLGQGPPFPLHVASANSDQSGGLPMHSVDDLSSFLSGATPSTKVLVAQPKVEIERSERHRRRNREVPR